MVVALIVLGCIFAMAARLGRVHAEQICEVLKEEEDRKARVRALYPDPLSYEERMGVRYGPEDPKTLK